MEEGVVVVGREHPLVGQQVLRGVARGPGVAHHGEELHRPRFGPAPADGRGVEPHAEVEAQLRQIAPRRLAGPPGAPFADLDAVALLRRLEQAHPAGQQQGPLLAQLGAVRRGVEVCSRVRVARPAQGVVVARRGRQLERERAPRAAGVGRGRRGEVVTRHGARCRKVAAQAVDRQLHGSGSSRVKRISTSSVPSAPWRWSVALSVTISTGRYSSPRSSTPRTPPAARPGPRSRPSPRRPSADAGAARAPSRRLRAPRRPGRGASRP